MEDDPDSSDSEGDISYIVEIKIFGCKGKYRAYERRFQDEIEALEECEHLRPHGAKLIIDNGTRRYLTPEQLTFKISEKNLNLGLRLENI